MNIDVSTIGMSPARTNFGIAPYSRKISEVVRPFAKKPVTKTSHVNTGSVNRDETIVYIGSTVNTLSIIMDREHIVVFCAGESLSESLIIF